MTGGSWPDELRNWYALADGTERTPAGYVLPFYCPLPLSAVISHWSMWVEAMAFIAGNADSEGPVWLSVSAMLADLAEGLWAGGRVGRGDDPSLLIVSCTWEVVGLDGGRPSLGDGLSLPPG